MIDGDLRRPPDAHVVDHLVRRRWADSSDPDVYAEFELHPRAGTLAWMSEELPVCDLCARCGAVSLARYDAPIVPET